jgi:hypothetical protein
MPHLLPTPQQMNSADSDDKLAAVLLNQASFDLTDLRPHRSAERSAAGVVEV